MKIQAVNPMAELCAFKDGTWLRIAGELVNDDRIEAKKYEIVNLEEAKLYIDNDYLRNNLKEIREH